MWDNVRVGFFDHLDDIDRMLLQAGRIALTRQRKSVVTADGTRGGKR